MAGGDQRTFSSVSFKSSLIIGSTTLLGVVAFYLGWGVRSCGVDGSAVLTYGVFGPVLHFSSTLAAVLIGFAAGGFARIERYRFLVIISAALIFVLASAIAGYSIMSAAGCRLDI